MYNSLEIEPCLWYSNTTWEHTSHVSMLAYYDETLSRKGEMIVSEKIVIIRILFFAQERAKGQMESISTAMWTLMEKPRVSIAGGWWGQTLFLPGRKIMGHYVIRTS